jgi:hypothetical protein
MQGGDFPLTLVLLTITMASPFPDRARPESDLPESDLSMRPSSVNAVPRSGDGPQPERRRSPRLEYCWPITVETPAGRSIRASTRNLAARGVLFHVDEEAAPRLGDRVRVVFHVPPAHQDREAYFQFRAEGDGRVVRLEAGGTPSLPVRGVAVEFDAPLALLESFVGLA